jgi:hypothetical protein
MSEKYTPKRAYEASPRRAEGTEDAAPRRMETTKRGTEVAPSTTGNRIVDAANRIAGFFDRLKIGYTNGMETAEAARDFAGNIADKAITGAIESGKVAVGVALLAGEAAIQLPGKAAKVADMALDTFSDAVVDGMESAGKWVGDKMESASDWINEKGTALNERANAGLEKIQAAFTARAEKAKARRETRRARRQAFIQRGVDTLNMGMETARLHGRALRSVGRSAVEGYRNALAAEKAKMAPDTAEGDVAIA